MRITDLTCGASSAKNATGSQTTFGDWKADYLIWRDEGAFPNLVGLTGNNLRTQQNTNKDEVFLSAFGIWRNAEEDDTYQVDGQQVTWENGGFFFMVLEFALKE